MDVLRKEVAAVLARHLQPGEAELQEHIESEGSFREGKVLFTVYLT